MGGHFGSRLRRVDGSLDAVNDSVVDSVFHVVGAIGNAVEPAMVGFVFSEKQLRRSFAVQTALPQFVMAGLNRREGYVLPVCASWASVPDRSNSRYCGTTTSAAGAAKLPRGRGSLP